jgi:hypothetical protein
MAVVNVLSAQLTNRDLVPAQLQDPRIAGSDLRGGAGAAIITSGDDIASIYRLFSIPAKAVLRTLKISSPDLGTTTIVNIGLYRTTKNGGTVVDADFFIATVSLKDGAIAKQEALNGNIVTLAKMETKLGDQTGPVTFGDAEYDVCLTLTAASDATGSVFVEGTWTEG